MRKLLFVLLPLLFVGTVSAQQVVSGVVKDSLGTALPGTTVVIKGTNNHAIADDDGAFSINTKKTPPFILRITSVGYKIKEVEVTELSSTPLAITLATNNALVEVVITSRRRVETAQEVPIPISVVGGGQVEATGSFNVNRLKELVPTVQLYSSNPRNTTLNVRGLGSTFGLNERWY